jgi:hypothetical protein
VLLFLSTVIATYGILSDSTATVIGAMIIAPLMTPILATTRRCHHQPASAVRPFVEDVDYEAIKTDAILNTGEGV